MPPSVVLICCKLEVNPTVCASRSSQADSPFVAPMREWRGDERGRWSNRERLNDTDKGEDRQRERLCVWISRWMRKRRCHCVSPCTPLQHVQLKWFVCLSGDIFTTQVFRDVYTANSQGTPASLNTHTACILNVFCTCDPSMSSWLFMTLCDISDGAFTNDSPNCNNTRQTKVTAVNDQVCDTSTVTREPVLQEKRRVQACA